MPRPILCDLDRDAIDSIWYRIKADTWSQGGFTDGWWLDPSSMYSGKGMLSMSSGLYSQIIEHNNQVDELLEDIQDGIRREVERMDRHDGFIQLHSVSGGAGSGLSKLISQHLADEYKKAQNVSYVLFPSESHKSRNMVVEPYNFTLCYNSLVRSSSMITAFSNQ